MIRRVTVWCSEELYFSCTVTVAQDYYSANFLGVHMHANAQRSRFDPHRSLMCINDRREGLAVSE